MSSLHIEAIPTFDDNYVWLLSDALDRAFVVDPGDSAPVQERLSTRGLSLRGILLTHWHPDHIGGVDHLKNTSGCTVYGPKSDKIAAVDNVVAEPDLVDVIGTAFRVIDVPGHTLDHIAYYADGMLFCGDTLFAGGCGRVFEGTHAMMRQSLGKLRKLPPSTRVYCAHEYTLANLAFAAAADPNNDALKSRHLFCQQQRERDEATVPSLLEEEIATNPFMRWDSPDIANRLRQVSELKSTSDDDVFAALREWKNKF